MDMDIRQTLHHLGEITGQITTDDLFDNIFPKFCIGTFLILGDSISLEHKT